MQVALHIGAHATEGERLLRSVQKNAEALAAAGILVPPHVQYRRTLRELMQAYAGGTLDPSTAREGALDAILGAARPDRLVMANPAFLCTPNRVFEGRELYPMLGLKLRALSAVFAPDRLELFLALRNPATFVPAVLSRAKATSETALLDGLAPAAIRWSGAIARAREAAPGARLVVWAHEDAPLIWGRLVRRLAGRAGAAGAAEGGPAGSGALLGEHDLLAQIMTEEGLRRYVAYLRTHPPQSAAQSARIIAAFLDKYVRPEEIEEEDLPDWPEAVIAEVTAGYEADLDAIAAMDGVEMIRP
ncbi:hypothetical protein [Wenxinia saemankumensis]|uniref:Sulfotransferase family protein n=1 Tax=Wenxinia saemankumensis TaxID=1447782 RepID=A0A1M6AHF7_9RHOB|nr:hypothetical protein [Wenxinia saemankumensis]SHI35758.1 hypothetical protein SAMN05444417_0429 [Wenxinia saemankumensis]